MRRFRLHIIEIDDIGRAMNKGAILGVVECDESDFRRDMNTPIDLNAASRIADEVYSVLEACK